MRKDKKLPQKLDQWKERLSKADTAYAPEVAKMDHREELYRGKRELTGLVDADMAKDTPHVRNIVFENIESQISSAFPMPKVTPLRKEDEHLAEKIEHFIRNEMERLPFDLINDMAERTVPIQGGVGFLVEWDNNVRTHSTVGAVDVALIHPKQFAPQPGVYTGIRDMDWFIIKQPTTKEEVWRSYGKSVYDSAEEEPELRGSGAQSTADDMVTKYIGYAVGENGGIDKFVWVNDVVLEDIPDYQSRRVPVCCKCGRHRPLHGQVIQNEQWLQPLSAEQPEDVAVDAAQQMAMQLAYGAPIEQGNLLDMIPVEPDEPAVIYDGGPCPWCGCEDFEDEQKEYEQVMLPVRAGRDLKIPGNSIGHNKAGEPVLKPTLIPFYKPNTMPILLQKSVSVYGQLLGNSDVDVMEDQQNTIKRLQRKIIDRIMKAGTRITLPDRPDVRMDPNDGEVIYIGQAADKQLIDVYDFKGDLQYEMAMVAQAYEESRQELGINDSFQGRRDPTATSGKAKEYAASKAAGRLESKRVMKNAAYAQLFELIFKNWLAYSDEPRPVFYRDHEGAAQYEQISRYDFLERDAAGQYWWNDQFLFSCDSAAPLASNREAMWQEARMNLQTGAFGDPKATETLILFWSKMEELHYPGAAATKKFLEERLVTEQERQQMLAAMQSAGTVPGAAGAQAPM